MNYEEFEILYFARRDINNVDIPFYIKSITSSAFEYCKKKKKK